MRYLLIVAAVLASLSPASVLADDYVAVYPSKDLEHIKVYISMTNMPVPAGFCNNPSNPDDCRARDINTYQLFEIIEPDTENVRADLRPILAAVESCEARCAEIDLRLKQPLTSGATYMLKIKGLNLSANPSSTATNKRFEVAAKPTATIKPSLDSSKRDEVLVKSEVPMIRPGANAVVDLGRKALVIGPNDQGITDVTETRSSIPATADISRSHFSQNELTVKLGGKFQPGVSYDLSIKGLTTTGKTPINATGTIQFAGLPSPPDDPTIDVTLSSIAARRQKAVFDLVAKLAPLHVITLGTSDQDDSERRKRANRKYTSHWAIEPNAAIDVGFRSTKSDNSITFAVPFTKNFWGSDVTSPGPTQIPIYAGWKAASWHHLAFVKFSVGPRLETDRKFQRINMLGNVRFDLNLTRFGDAGTIGGKRQNLKYNLQDDAKLVEIDYGFKMIPYVSFDLGGHVNNETVTNKDKNVSVFVPHHRIFRIYAGATPTFQWKKFGVLQTLSLDESLVFIATRETIGFTTDDGAELRRLRGFHPHSLVKWNIALDPAGHYNFVLSYENGRLAPNFEYLNKLTTGFRVAY